MACFFPRRIATEKQRWKRTSTIGENNGVRENVREKIDRVSEEHLLRHGTVLWLEATAQEDLARFVDGPAVAARAVSRLNSWFCVVRIEFVRSIF